MPVAVDQHLVPMTGTEASITAYDAALDDLLAFRPAVLDHLGTFAEEFADVPMGHVLAGHLQLMSTDARDLDAVRAAVAALDSLPCNPRELAHRNAIAAWCNGDWVAASAMLDDLLVHHPTDLLALMMGHQLDFFLGDASNLRDRVGRSLGAIDHAHHHHAFVLGMRAFGLEESGDYAAAEDAARGALDVHRDDVWATHALAHVHEMRGETAEGLDFLSATEADWGSGNLFTVHLWWHHALFLLEQHHIDELLAVYDREIHHSRSSGVPMEMLDASALLWRLHLDGIDSGPRFAALSDGWAATGADVSWYAFNDAHAAMAHAGAGRLAQAREVVARLERSLDAGGGRPGGNAAMIASAGLAAARSVVVFAEGRHDDVIELLVPTRRQLHRFGGSHAQRDAWQRTLIESAIRAGRRDLAEALLRERLSTRPDNDFGRVRQQTLAGTARG